MKQHMETTTSALPERILYLCACAAWAAKGDLEHLETVVPQALDHGVTINELKDAFAQLYAYAGFPRSLNALGVLEKILNAKMVNGTLSLGTWQWGKPFVRPAVWDDAGEALRTGTAMQTRDEGGTPWDYTFCPQADYYMKSHLFGDIYASDQLTPAVRELVTVAALSAMDGVTPQFEGHKECAVFMGNTPEQVAELCRWLENTDNVQTALANDDRIDLGRFEWTREPAECEIKGDTIAVTTKPHTDLWQRTYYHFRNDNAPVLQMKTNERFFSFVVKTDFSQSHHRFDQCGIVMYLDSENWLKASVEYENEQFQHLGSVVTNGGYSDWATTAIPADVKTMWYRFSRREDDYCIECSADGVHFSQMRICHMHAGAGEIRFGIYACSPENSSFTALFSDMKITTCAWQAHDGQQPD